MATYGIDLKYLYLAFFVCLNILKAYFPDLSPDGDFLLPVWVMGANIFYVGGTGATDNAGAVSRPQSNPAATIAYVFANTDLGPGDRVIVQATGTYARPSWGADDIGDATGYVSLETTADAIVTIKPDIDLPPLWLDSKQYCRIAGNFIADGTNVTSYPCIGVRDSSHIIIDGVTAQNSVKPGIQVDLNAATENKSDITIQNFTVKDTAGAAAHGVFVATNVVKTYVLSDVHVINGTVTNTGGAGIRMTGRITDSSIEGNTASNLCNDSTGDWGIYANGWRTVVSTGGTAWSALDGNNESYYVLTGDLPVVAVGLGSHNWLTAGSGVGSLNDGEYYVDTSTNPDRLYVNLGGLDPENQTVFIVHAFADNITITGNSVSGTKSGGNDGHGIGLEVGAKNSHVTRNLSESNGDAVSGGGYVSYGAKDSTFSYNLSRSNSGSGYGMSSSTGINVYNNVSYLDATAIADKAALAVSGWGSTTIKNNIGYSSFQYGIAEIAGYTGTLTHDHNLLFGSAVDNWGTGTSKGATDIELDPFFRDAAAGDFRLKGSSPAINKGVDVGLTTDYDGLPICGLPDIGAYEYQLYSGSLRRIRYARRYR